jgi:hypothetical protein
VAVCACVIALINRTEREPASIEPQANVLLAEAE